MRTSQRQAQSAYDRLRLRIIEGELLPGEPLREQALAEALSMSRTPLREAFRRLESDGLLESTGRGVIVTALNPEALAGAYQVRAALEALTAEQAALRQREGKLAPAELDELERYGLDAERATAARDLGAAVAHNRRFHRQIALLGGNELAVELLDSLWDQIVVSTRVFLARTESGDEVADDHRALIRAIRMGDFARAATVAREHVLRTLTMKRTGSRVAGEAGDESLV